MQVEPIKPMLKAPGAKRLKLKVKDSLSTLAFKSACAATMRLSKITPSRGLCIELGAAIVVIMVGRCRLTLDIYGYRVRCIRI